MGPDHAAAELEFSSIFNT